MCVPCLQFQIIEKHVEDTLEKMPDLHDKCKTFLKTAKEINTR